MKNFILVMGLGLGTLARAGLCQKPESSVGQINFIQAFSSKYVDTRSVAVWLPNGYTEQKKYKVIYLHDGQNLFDANITWNHQEWNIDEHLQKLIDNHEIEPCIAVGIWNNGSKRHIEYFPQKPFETLEITFRDSLIKATKRNEDTPMFAGEIVSDHYLLFLTKELIPYIEKHFSVGRRSKDRLIAGASMGGLISWYAALEYPHVFGRAACFSTHWTGIWPKDDPQQILFKTFLDYASKKNNLNTHWYFDRGTEGLDQYYGPCQEKINVLYAKNKHFKSIVHEGFDHSEKSWSHHFEEAIIHLWK